MSEWEYMMGQRVAELEQELEAAEAKLERLVIAAYQSGYSRGHNDTAEGCYNGACEDDDEAALEWLAQQEQTK